MAQIKVETIITITDDFGNEREITTSKTFTGLTVIEERDYTMAANDTQIAWDPTNVTTDALQTFKFAMFLSDGVIDLESTANEGDANEELDTKRLTDQLPLFLGADDSYSNHSASDAIAGTLDVIDKFRLDDPNGAARKVKAILAT